MIYADPMVQRLVLNDGKCIDIFMRTSKICGSVTHDFGPLAQSVEQQAFNLLVLRSNRRRPMSYPPQHVILEV